jgi:hypothetical protein
VVPHLTPTHTRRDEGTTYADLTNIRRTKVKIRKRAASRIRKNFMPNESHQLPLTSEFEVKDK